jgi:hypothetical protein
MPEDNDHAPLLDARQRRVKIVAWVVIIALILVGGGATVTALLLG